MSLKNPVTREEQNSVTKWRPTWKAYFEDFYPGVVPSSEGLSVDILGNTPERFSYPLVVSDSIYSPKLGLTASPRPDGDKPETALPRGPKAEHEYFCNCPLYGSPEHLKWLPPCMPRARLQKLRKSDHFCWIYREKGEKRLALGAHHQNADFFVRIAPNQVSELCQCCRHMGPP